MDSTDSAADLAASSDSESPYDENGRLWGKDKGPYAEGGAWHYAESVKGRCFFITTDWVHPDTGAVIITPERIEEAAAKRPGDMHCWVNHDKDVYLEEDVEKNPRAVLGQPKPAHVHVIENRKNEASIAQVARAYGVAPNFVGLKRQSAFGDLAEYQTHEHQNQRAKGKHLYADDEIHANFDYRAFVDAHVANRKLGKTGNGKLTAEDILAMKIQETGLTLRQARIADPLAFSRNKSRMVSCRSTYLENKPMPPYRMNYYLGGPSGAGKSEAGLMLARVIASVYYPDLEVDEAVFVVGRKGVEFQKYDGQPILVWDDYRVLSLINAFGGSRDALWPAFDISPKPLDVNRKYGSIRLSNAFNIITGVTPYMEFLDNLAGEYEYRGEKHEAEDKNQAFRRVLFVTEVTPDTLKVYFNKGIVGTGTYQQYEHYATLLTSMKHHAETMQALDDEGQRNDYRLAVGRRVLSPMVDAHATVRPKESLSLAEAVSRGLEGSSVLIGDDLVQHDTDRAIEASVTAEIDAHHEGLEAEERRVDSMRHLAAHAANCKGADHSPWEPCPYAD